eukprot:Colp12_sorted_trinity150504_noHs@1314
MLNVYKCVSEVISNAIAQQGLQVATTVQIKSMRAVKKETLRLLETWVTRSEDPKLVVEHFIPPLLEAVLGDYQRNNPLAREPEVLSCMAAIVNKLEGHI